MSADDFVKKFNHENNYENPKRQNIDSLFRKFNLSEKRCLKKTNIQRKTYKESNKISKLVSKHDIRIKKQNLVKIKQRIDI